MKNNAKSDILRATSGGLQVFQYYLRDYPIPSKVNFRSPFYDDGMRVVMCFVGVMVCGGIRTTEMECADCCDCFWFVGKLYGLEGSHQFP